MSLNNVHYWNKDRWQKISAEEFVRNYPNAQISAAKDKYFWCEMCGQYVTLANGKQRSYFNPSSTELEKDCGDRSKNFSKVDWINFSNPAHSLPLRICVEHEFDHYQSVSLLFT